MKWHELKNGYTMATVESRESIEQAMTEFCQHIKEYVIPKNDGVAWDYIRIELWPDSGRMIAFPSSTSTITRIEKVGCQVVFADLLAVYERLADSGLDDNAFIATLRDVEREWIEEFLDAARHIGLTGYRIVFTDCDGECPIWNAMGT